MKDIWKVFIHMCAMTHSRVWHDSFIWKICYGAHMFESCHTYQHIMSHISNHVTHMGKSCHTYGWVMSHIWVSHVTHKVNHVTRMDKSCHTYGWVMSHMRVSHVTHMRYGRVVFARARCSTRVMSHIQMSHVTHTNESCHINEWVMTHIWICHATRMNALWHTHEKNCNTHTM